MPPQTDKGIVQELCNLIRRNRLDYNRFNRLCAKARGIVGLTQPKAGRRLKKLLTEDQLKAVMRVVEQAVEPGDYRVAQSETLRNTIMIRMLFYTGARVSELAGMRIEDVDIDGGRIFISEGKGNKDRYVLFSTDDLRLVLKAYISTLPAGEEWLFPTRYRKPISERWVQKIVKGVARQAGVSITPHGFRHQLLTTLTAANMPAAKIMLISGHANSQSLQVYQHMALPDVKPDYDAAMGKVKL